MIFCWIDDPHPAEGNEMAMHFKSCVGEPRVSRQCHRKRKLTLRSDARFFRSWHPAVEYSQPATDVEDPHDIRGRLCAVSAKGAKTQAPTDTIRNSVPNHLAIETVTEEPDLSFNSRHHGIGQNPRNFRKAWTWIVGRVT